MKLLITGICEHSGPRRYPVSNLLICCVTWVIASFIVQASAKELSVSVNHSAASDENPGTPAKPFKTIGAAALKAQPGDHVIIHAGDYRETVILNTSGTATAPIIFETAAGGIVTIKGSDLITNWVQDSRDVWKAQLPPIKARPTDSRNPNYWTTNDVRQVFAKDGVTFEAEPLSRVISKDQLRSETFFCDPANNLLFVRLLNSQKPAHLEAARRGAWLSIFGSHIVVRGIQMRHASTTAFANWPACGLTGDDITVENCTITWGDFCGISIGGNRNRLLHSLIACHGDSGIGGTGKMHTLENCRVIYNNLARFNPAWHAGGAKLIPHFEQGMIRHNEFAHNLGPGLWLDGSCNNNTIDGDFSHDNEGPGIMVEISKGNLISNNICSVNRNVLSGYYLEANGTRRDINYSEQQSAVSRLPTLYHAGEGRGIYVSSSPETQVVNNTCYLNQGEGICVEGPPRTDGSVIMTTSDYVILNNISVFNHGSQLTIQPAPAGANSRAISDYNLLFSVGAVFAKLGWGGSAAFSLEQWRKLSHQDEHSIEADPRFAMATMNDFRLLSSSLALHAGKPLPKVDHDYFGQARGKNQTAIGACENAAGGRPRPIIDSWNLPGAE